MTDTVKRGLGFGMILVVIYLFNQIAMPYNRFPFLAEIRLERILAILILLALLSRHGSEKKESPISVLLVVFFVWMWVCYILSPFKDAAPAIVWRGEYWKAIVFYFLILYSIERLDHIVAIVIAITVIFYFTQLHSWHDFLHGGSYVYQQGMKRMINTWAASGVGSANAWGEHAILFLPFGMAWLRLTKSRRVVWAMRGYFVLCCLSVVFSGTRGSVVTLIGYLIVAYWRRIFKFKVIVGLAIVVALALNVMPQDLKHRYFGLMFPDEVSKTDKSKTDEIAKESAQSRIDGLIDGWKLGFRSPIVGYGPGGSAMARHDLLKLAKAIKDADVIVQLHNLYGQVPAETGFIGVFLFASILIVYFRGLSTIRPPPDDAIEPDELRKFQEMARLLRHVMVIVLVYGMFTHSLYHDYWMNLYALQVALVHEWRKARGKEKHALAKPSSSRQFRQPFSRGISADA